MYCTIDHTLKYKKNNQWYQKYEVYNLLISKNNATFKTKLVKIT